MFMKTPHKGLGICKASFQIVVLHRKKIERGKTITKLPEFAAAASTLRTRSFERESMTCVKGLYCNAKEGVTHALCCEFITLF